MVRLSPLPLSLLLATGLAAAGCAGDGAAGDPPVQARLILSEAVPTVATARVVADGATRVVVEVEPAGGETRVVPATLGDDGAFEATLLGFKPDTDVRAVAYATIDGSEVESGDLSFTTGSVPSILPETSVWRDEAAGTAAGGIFITSLVPEGPPVILDGDGDYLWWRDPHANTPFTLSPVQPARDGHGLLYLVWSADHVEGSYDDDRRLLDVSWNGTIDRAIQAPDAHHDFAELPDGSIAMIVYDEREFDGLVLRGDKLVERTFEGDEVTIWSIWDHIPYDPDRSRPANQSWGHCNAVRYDEAQDAYYLSSHDFNVLFKIDRASGDVLWMMGRADGDFEMAEGQEWFVNQHRFQPLGEDTLLLFDNGTETEAASRAIELAIDEERRRLDIAWSYQADPPLGVYSFGDVTRLPSGNTLIDWSTSGQMDEVTEDGQPVWRLNLPLGHGFGYVTWREGLGVAEE